MRALPILATAAVAVLLAGAASARETPAQPNASSTAGRDSTGSPQPTTSAGTTVQSGTASDAQPAAPTASAAPADASATAGAGASPGGPTTTANTPTGDAPSSYPVCTKRGQDRCRSTGHRAK